MAGKLEELMCWGGMKKDIAFLVISAIALVVSFAADGAWPVDAAWVAIVGDNISELPFLVALSKHTMRVIKGNITFSMTLNFIAIALALTAVLNPVTGALVHNCGSVFVVVNSSFLLGWKAKGQR